MKTTAFTFNFSLFTFSLFAFSLSPFSLFGQNDRYTQVMLETLEKLNHASGNEATLACAGQFERIASAEKELWLPYYYGAYSLIVLSFGETDGMKKDQILDRAQQNLDKALGLNPHESELHALQAFLYPSWVTVDPMARGMQYIEKMAESLKKAKTSNPENPRALFLEAIHTLNMPPAMGGGPEIAKPIFERADSIFTAFHNDNPLWPAWGKEVNKAELEKLQ
ncbi:MAG: hypothetical protein V2B15_15035 [Bacteroidota bacterium]